MKLLKKCPLLIILCVSGILFSIVGLANRKGVYMDFKGTTVMTPQLAAVFQGIKDGRYPWTDPDTAPAIAQDEENSEAESDNRTEDQAKTDGGADTGSHEAEAPGAFSDEGNGDIASAGMADSPEDRIYDFVRVEEDYFDDAVFIGDSRTQGMLEYGGLEDRAKFYCQTSLTVYDLFKKDKAYIKEDGESLTLTQALTKHQFGKVYLMLGINEMGTGTAESFFEEYARAVLQIRRLQPDAVIFVQANMRVAEDKNAEDPIFNNMNINIRNVEIQTLADQNTVFYIDVNEVVCDENGNLYADWTNDQIHLKAKYYGIWKEFLLDHGIVRGSAAGD